MVEKDGPASILWPWGPWQIWACTDDPGLFLLSPGHSSRHQEAPSFPLQAWRLLVTEHPHRRAPQVAPLHHQQRSRAER